MYVFLGKQRRYVFSGRKKQRFSGIFYGKEEEEAE
jgi:hypothetical protein